MKIKKAFSRMFTSLAFILSMFGFSAIVNNANLVHAEGEKVPESLTASYNGTVLAGNKLSIPSLTVKVIYSDSSEMPCAGLAQYWYNGSQIQDPINYVFGVELIGNLEITVKYLELETTFELQVVGHEITFNSNTGTGTMEADEYVGDYILPTNGFTAPAGKQFKGWSTSSDGAVIEGTTYNVTEPVEFFAIWEDLPAIPESLTATYTGKILSGTTINPMDIEIVLTYSDDSTEPVNAGIVEYWYEGEQIENPIAYVFDHQILGGFGNKAVTVKYQGLETTMIVEIVGHEITFNSNGGTNNMPADVWVGDYGLPQNQFVAPEGKKFAGWALTSDGNIINEPSYNVTQDTEFFAIWVDLENVTITFDAGDGTGTMSPVVVVEGSTYTLPENGFTAPAGHEFHAWNIVDTFDNFAEGHQVIIETNTTFVALWTQLEMEEITATYTGTILAGTTINPAGISINAVYEDSSTTPINVGNVEYWYNGSQIQDPVNYVFGVELIGNINITVKYEGLETTMAVTVVGHAITFNANGGTGTMTATEYVGNYTLPANGFTAPEGKHFKGWATSATGNVIEGTTYNVTSDTTLYAIWEENSSSGPATPEQPENNNPTAEPESKGLGVSAIVGIVMASLVVLGTGGFAIIWFIVKKKTWADFVAIFMKK